MGDTVYEYVQMANAEPTAKFTDASGGQTTTMDNITAAGDVVSVVILNQPFVVESSSPTIEVGQSFITFLLTSSSIVDRVLFETTESRMAFMQNVLSQWSAILPALGIPVEPEMVWTNDQFEAATISERAAMEEIEAAPDVQTRNLLSIPNINYLRSPTVRPNETVIQMAYPETTEDIRIYLSSVLNQTQFIHRFIIPLATAQALIAAKI